MSLPINFQLITTATQFPRPKSEIDMLVFFYSKNNPRVEPYYRDDANRSPLKVFLPKSFINTETQSIELYWEDTDGYVLDPDLEWLEFYKVKWGYIDSINFNIDLTQ